MFNSGLVSVSFRNLSPKNTIENAAFCNLLGIEWGSDVHVPIGDLDNAKKVKLFSEKYNIKSFAYGSYYRLGQGNIPFKDVAQTAAELNAPIIRIWGGTKSPSDIDIREYDNLVEEAKQISEISAEYGSIIALECHLGTITEDYNSAIKFLNDVGCNNFKTYWQPNQTRDFEYNLKAAKMLAPYTVGIHMFHWDTKKRYPLCEGKNEWTEYLKMFDKDSDIPVMLEFMHDDRIESLKDTAKTMFEIIK